MPNAYAFQIAALEDNEGRISAGGGGPCLIEVN